MTETKQFIEDCVKGGWKPKDWEIIDPVQTIIDSPDLFINEALLDPAAWRACGVTRGWATDEERVDYEPHRMGSHSDTWGCAGDDDPCFCDAPKTASMYQHKFLDHLQSGDTIEQALKKIK